jgi:hypothetical protein
MRHPALRVSGVGRAGHPPAGHQSAGRAGTPVAPQSLRVAAADEIGNCVVGDGQRLFVGQENYAEMLGSWALAETGAVHYRHVLLANLFSHEDVVAFRDIDAGVSVERSARGYAAYARGFGAPLHG